MEAIKSDAHCYEYEKNCDESDNDDSNEYGPDNCITGSEFINNLVAESKSHIVDGERPNPYYCHGFPSNTSKTFPSVDCCYDTR